jgi:hypothetical protein
LPLRPGRVLPRMIAIFKSLMEVPVNDVGEEVGRLNSVRPTSRCVVALFLEHSRETLVAEA